MNSVAVLGLGLMGGGMAGRLLAGGTPLTVWNRTRERTRGWEAGGARVAATPREAAATADVVISMVADDEASRAVWYGPAGALAGARAGALLIESSTLSPGCVETLAARAAQHGCAFLEAPVTGSRTHAASGELLFLAGGDPGTVDAARPILAMLGRDVVHVGPVGSGARLKLVNNFLCGVQAAAVAEAIAMAERCGLDLDAALPVLLNGAAGSPLVRTVAARMAARDYTLAFPLELMRKDLGYAVAEAARHGVALRLAEAAQGRFDAAVAAGRGRDDFAAVVEPVRGPAAGRTSGL